MTLAILARQGGRDLTPVSYTHLDVYKRQVSYRSGERRGLDSFTLATKGGKVHRRVPVQVRAGSVDPSTVSVRTLGDSVTAGFGYFGSTGSAVCSSVRSRALG